jgi:hypothetical protein
VPRLAPVLRAIAANTPRAACLVALLIGDAPARPRTRERCGSVVSLLLVPIASFQALGDGGGIHSSFETFQWQNSATFEVSFRSFLFPFSCSLLRLNSSSPPSKTFRLALHHSYEILRKPKMFLWLLIDS